MNSIWTVHVIFGALELTVAVGLVMGFYVIARTLKVVHDDYGAVRSAQMQADARIDILMALLCRITGTDEDPAKQGDWRK